MYIVLSKFIKERLVAVKVTVLFPAILATLTFTAMTLTSSHFSTSL